MALAAGEKVAVCYDQVLRVTSDLKYAFDGSEWGRFVLVVTRWIGRRLRSSEDQILCLASQILTLIPPT